MVWDFREGGRQFTWRWKSKCLVNKCLPHLTDMERKIHEVVEKTLIKWALLGSSLSTTPSSYYTIVIYGDSSFLEQAFYLKFF